MERPTRSPIPREGRQAQDRRKIEDSFYRILGEEGVPEDAVHIMPLSSPKATPSPQSRQAAPADLKVGHGPGLRPKKKVEGAKKLIAIASGKGGVGKSTVAVNLAYALMKKGLKVGLMDADIYGPSIPMMLGKRTERPKASEGEKKIAPSEAHGLKFLSFGQFIEEKDPVIWRGPMLGGVLNQFLFDARWDDLDVLLIDLPPGTGDVHLSLVQSAQVDGAIVVTTPGETALLNSFKGLAMFRQMGVEIIGLVENMSFFICDKCGEEQDIFGRGGGEKKAQEAAVKFLGAIPLTTALREAGDTGRPYMAQSDLEGTPVGKAYLNIAEELDKIVLRSGGFFKNLFR